jgi:hypothetical protein
MKIQLNYYIFINNIHLAYTTIQPALFEHRTT